MYKIKSDEKNLKGTVPQRISMRVALVVRKEGLMLLNCTVRHQNPFLSISENTSAQTKSIFCESIGFIYTNAVTAGPWFPALYTNQ